MCVPFPLPIHRETTKNITEFGCQNSLSRRFSFTGGFIDAINRSTTKGKNHYSL
jgi:hypothetical protein